MSASPVKRLNGVAVLRALRAVESMSLSELCESTRLSRPTIEDALAELIADGLLTSIAPGGASSRPVGRPAKRYSFRADAGAVVACELGVHEFRVILADLSGEVLARASFAVAADLPAGDRLATMLAAVDGMLERHEQRPQDVWAIGASTTGIVDPDGVVTRSTRIADWAGTDVAGALASAFPQAIVVVGNDARCAALAEHWVGAGADIDASVTVLAGTTVAAAITIDGRPYLGRHGASGEIGGLQELGWPHAVAALSGLSAGDGRLEIGDSEPDRAALAEFIDHFVLGLVTLVTVLDTPRLIIAGELATVGDRLTEPLQRRLDAACLFPVEVRASALGVESSVVGALRLALDAVDASLFDPRREQRAIAS